MAFRDRLAHAWNAFRSNETDPITIPTSNIGPSSSLRKDNHRLRLGNESSIIASIYSRIANDVASIEIRHIRVDQNGNLTETMSSGLNTCLSLSSNIDQNYRDFMIDLVLSMLDDGVVAIVPTETNVDPINSGSFDITAMRTAEIVQWYPQSVKCKIYNPFTGEKEERIFPKNTVAIIENPFYAIMNEPNSTLRRLIYKLKLLDSVDDTNSSAKLDLIIQLPYTIRSETRRQQAENRRNAIIDQLESSKYGIAYIDATEHVTQLNRSIESNLMPQIEYLTKEVYSQLGIGEDVFLGSANEQAMINYNNRVIEPILTTITTEMTRKFLTKTARTQGQKVAFFRDPFKLVPVSQLADIADKFTRNEIMTSNEMRAKVGLPASKDNRADQLINKNMPEATGVNATTSGETDMTGADGNYDPMGVGVDDIPDS